LFEDCMTEANAKKTEAERSPIGTPRTATAPGSLPQGWRCARHGNTRRLGPGAGR
jgi:hypothetical protein